MMFTTFKCAQRAFLALPTLTLATAAIALSACTPGDMICEAARGSFAVEYTLQSGSGACSMIEGEVVGIQNFHDIEDGLPLWEEPKFAMKAISMGERLANAQSREADELNPEQNKPYAWGQFAETNPDGDSFCRAATLEPATLSLPALEAIVVEDDPETLDVDESEDSQLAEAATVISYTWSNLGFYTTPDSRGSQFTADLSIARDGCNAQFRARGVFPAVECESDAECEAVGSGINPDFATHCNTAIGLCVLNVDPPSLN